MDSKVYVPGLLAKELKECGFNSPCSFYYLYYKVDDKIGVTPNVRKDFIEVDHNALETRISIPTWGQAIDFIRDKYYLAIHVQVTCTVNEILSYDGVIHYLMKADAPVRTMISADKIEDENFHKVQELTIIQALKFIKENGKR